MPTGHGHRGSGVDEGRAVLLPAVPGPTPRSLPLPQGLTRLMVREIVNSERKHRGEPELKNLKFVEADKPDWWPIAVRPSRLLHPHGGLVWRCGRERAARRGGLPAGAPGAGA